MSDTRRITEARLKRLETGTEHDPVWFELLAAEIRRLRGLIVGGSAEVNAIECGFSYGPQWNALLAEASAIREEQGR